MNDAYEKITDSELEIMRVLWEAGRPLSLAEIRRELQSRMSWESSTVKTLVQRLNAKGAICQEKRDVYYYAPEISREEYGGEATRSLIDRLYNGKAGELVAALVDSELSDDDIAELRSLLAKED